MSSLFKYDKSASFGILCGNLEVDTFFKTLVIIFTPTRIVSPIRVIRLGFSAWTASGTELSTHPGIITGITLVWKKYKYKQQLESQMHFSIGIGPHSFHPKPFHDLYSGAPFVCATAIPVRNCLPAKWRPWCPESVTPERDCRKTSVICEESELWS